MISGLFSTTRELPRLREISSVFVRHGLRDLVRRAGIATLLEHAGHVLQWGEASEIAHLEPQQRALDCCTVCFNVPDPKRWRKRPWRHRRSSKISDNHSLALHKVCIKCCGPLGPSARVNLDTRPKKRRPLRGGNADADNQPTVIERQV
jgi:hypothetical protein